MLRYPFSIAFLRLTLAFPRLPVKGCAVRCSRRISSQLEVFASLSPRPPRRSVFSALNSFFRRVPKWQVRSASLLYFSFPNEQKITTNQATEEKSLRRADGRACGVADALRPLQHLRIQRPRSAGRSCRSGARKSKGQDCATRARALAMPHRRRAHLPALRLPRAAGIVAEKDRAGAFGNSALSSTGRSGHRPDEQASRLRTPGRRNGYRRSQRNAGFCRRCPRL